MLVFCLMQKKAIGNLVTYPLLGELAGTLVLGVAEQLNDTLLVRGEAVLEKHR